MEMKVSDNNTNNNEVTNGQINNKFKVYRR